MGPRNHVLDEGPDPPWEGTILEERGNHCKKYRDPLPSPVRKQPNRLWCRLDCGLGLAQWVIS